MSLQKWKDELQKRQTVQALVKDYEEKVKMHKFERGASRDMYKRMFEPVTETLGDVSEKVGEVRGAIKALPAAMPQPATDLELLFEEPALEAPPPLTANLDAGLDREILEKHDFTPPSELVSGSFDDWIEADDKASDVIRKLGVQKRKHRDKNSIEYKTLMEESAKVNKYRERVKNMRENRTMFGKGQRKRHAYKLSHGGKYGNLNIDLPSLLGHHRLKAHKGGELVLDTAADQDFVDLVTKRFNNNKNYSALSQNLFKKLTELSELPIHQTSKKYTLLTKCNPEELIDQLELICGSIRAGNDSQLEKTNGIHILDKLLKQKIINKEKHEGLYRKYFE